MMVERWRCRSNSAEAILGVLNNNSQGHICPQARRTSEASWPFKKACPKPFEGFVLSHAEGKAANGLAHPEGDHLLAWLILKGETIVSAQSVLSVREQGKLVTCLRRTYPAEVASDSKAGNATWLIPS